MKRQEMEKLAESIIEAMGGKVVIQSTELPKLKCRARGCGGELEDEPIGMQDPGSHMMHVVCACKKCERLHGRKGGLVKVSKKDRKVFLDRKTGCALVKDRRGKVVMRVWTTAVKTPQNPRSIMIV